MSTENPAPHPVATRRKARRWSQAELAEQAGIPRSTISAIEGRRLTPSVTAALAVARALQCGVDLLFDENASTALNATWAWQPENTPCRYWEAQVGGRQLRYPVETLSANAFAHDGVWRQASRQSGLDSVASDTLVLASCDPAAAMLASEYARTTGMRLLILKRGGLAALALLKQGLVHVAGLHFSSSDEPQRNANIARDELGEGFHLLRAADWQEGVALKAVDRNRSLQSLSASSETWALREPGSAARDCLDRLLGENRAPTGQVMLSHRAVADAVRAGWARAGVCVQLCAEEAGLKFLAVREESLDFCLRSDSLTDRRITGLINVLRSREYRRRLGELPGYHSRETGILQTL